jgi:hypothetical protein
MAQTPTESAVNLRAVSRRALTRLPGSGGRQPDPHPRRLRVGRYRARYEITDATREIFVTHIGRSG